MERGYKLDFDAIERFRLTKGITQKELISGICNKRTFTRWQEGGIAFAANVAALAQKLGAQPADIIKQLPPSTIRVRLISEIDIPADSVNNPQIEALVRSLSVLIAAAAPMSVVRVQKGSTIIDIDMHPDDARNIVDQFITGELRQYSILAITAFDPAKPSDIESRANKLMNEWHVELEKQLQNIRELRHNTDRQLEASEKRLAAEEEALRLAEQRLKAETATDVVSRVTEGRNRQSGSDAAEHAIEAVEQIGLPSETAIRIKRLINEGVQGSQS